LVHQQVVKPVGLPMVPAGRLLPEYTAARQPMETSWARPPLLLFYIRVCLTGFIEVKSPFSSNLSFSEERTKEDHLSQEKKRAGGLESWRLFAIHYDLWIEAKNSCQKRATKNI